MTYLNFIKAKNHTNDNSLNILEIQLILLFVLYFELHSITLNKSVFETYSKALYQVDIVSLKMSEGLDDVAGVIPSRFMRQYACTSKKGCSTSA